jgi:hypothetical protein
MSLTPEQLEKLTQLGVDKGLEKLRAEVGESLPGYASDAIGAAIKAGVKAAFEAARLAEIKIEHGGDVTGSLEL